MSIKCQMLWSDVNELTAKTKLTMTSNRTAKCLTHILTRSLHTETQSHNRSTSSALYLPYIGRHHHQVCLCRSSAINPVGINKCTSPHFGLKTNCIAAVILAMMPAYHSTTARIIITYTKHRFESTCSGRACSWLKWHYHQGSTREWRDLSDWDRDAAAP